MAGTIISQWNRFLGVEVVMGKGCIAREEKEIRQGRCGGMISRI